MPSHSRRSRSRFPLWLVVLVAVAGWVYNRYFSASQQMPQRETRSESRSKAPTRSTPRGPRRAPSESSRRQPKYSPSAPSGRSPREIEGALQRDVVIKVSDGDTVKLQRAGTVRLIGVDCPEKAQDGGQDAKDFTTAALLGKTIEVEPCAKQPTDRYGRVLGFIYLLDRRGNRVLFNSELVRQGYARVYSLRPCTVDEELWNKYYAEAQASRRGLFATLGEVPDAAAYRRAQR